MIKDVHQLRSDLNMFCDFETTGTNVDHDNPIQFAAIFLDTDLDEVARIESTLIHPGSGEWFLQKGNEIAWNLPYNTAAEFHKIVPYHLFEYGVGHGTMCEIIADKISDAKYNSTLVNNDSRVVVWSDNVCFEYALLKKMYRSSGMPWPFHYSGRDTNALTETLGIEEKESVHNSMDDVVKMVNEYKEAIAKLGDLYVFAKAKNANG